MDKLRNVFGKVSAVGFWVMALVVGLAMTGIGIWQTAKPQAELVKVQAEVTEVIEETNETADGQEISYSVRVKYEADGKEYEGTVGGNSFSKVGDTVTVQYEKDRPENVSNVGAQWLEYVLIAVGAGFSVLAVFMLIRSFGGKGSPENVKADPSLSGERAALDPGETGEYYFHFTGKLNQSYIMETTARTPVYEAVCDRIGVVRPFVFTFKDRRRGAETTCRVTHTMTQRYSGGVLGFSVPTESTFRMDGEDVWVKLAKNGYSLSTRLDGAVPGYDVLFLGEKVATLKPSGVSALKDGHEGALGNIPTKGIYAVTCCDRDLDMVFLACFTAARVELF